MRGVLVNETHTTRDWLNSIFSLSELLSLTEDELVQLEEIEGDFALEAAWWRRRREREYILERGYEPVAIDGCQMWVKCHAGDVLSREEALRQIREGRC
jgi:hypothetical protein